MMENSREDLVRYLSGFVNDQRRELLQHILNQRTRHITVVLEDIYYSQNASAVVRTSECLGLQELHVIENEHGYSTNPDVVRGASKWLEIHRHNNNRLNNTASCIEKLKQRGYAIIATTPDADAIAMQDLPVKNKFALCFGTEESGLTRDLLSYADYKMRVPIVGFTRSYNISVCAGICLYYLRGKLDQENIDWHLEEGDRDDLYIQWLVKSTPNGGDILSRYNQSTN